MTAPFSSTGLDRSAVPPWEGSRHRGSQLPCNDRTLRWSTQFPQTSFPPCTDQVPAIPKAHENIHIPCQTGLVRNRCQDVPPTEHLHRQPCRICCRVRRHRARAELQSPHHAGVRQACEFSRSHAAAPSSSPPFRNHCSVYRTATRRPPADYVDCCHAVAP